MFIPCSVGILTFNSGQTLKRALRSVSRFGEIIICDGGSIDETLTIARQFNAKIITQDRHFLNPGGGIKNFAGVRNQTLEAAKYDWFLYIDSDEELSPEAAEEIKAVVTAPLTENSPLAYWLPRKTVIGGEVIDCATAYPNHQMRLFHKRGVVGFIKTVHERIALKDHASVGKLRQPEYVPLDLGPAEMRRKQLTYLAIEVERHASDTFWQWLRGPVRGALHSSLGYTARHIRLLLFCRGKKMPLWIEWMHHWYNWKLIMLTGAKFFRRARRR